MNMPAATAVVAASVRVEPAPILLVEDDPGLREALRGTLEQAGFSVCEAADGHQALSLVSARDFALVLSDVRMPELDGQGLLARLARQHPDLPVMLMTAYGSVSAAVDAMRCGAVDYLEKPFEPADLVRRVGRFLQPATAGDDQLVAVDRSMRDVLALAARVAVTDVTAMVCGESGTGKELVARYIHRQSPRAAGPFVAINCAAIPENLLEATLFGHEKGAFTGAHQARAGKFEQASGGTLLLDEITEMDIGLQAKLLRVIQEREVERVGGSRTIRFDVRLIATTNRDLAGEVRAGRFREDLYYRLNVVPIVLPALRDRPADLLPLAETLLARAARAGARAVPVLAACARQRLRAHAWPGNVRELDNLMQRALVLQPGPRIEAADLRLPLSDARDAMASSTTAASAGTGATSDALAGSDRPAGDGVAAENLRGHEQRMILEALAALGGNRQDVARQLGISPRTLRYKLARMREAGVAVPGTR